MMESKYTNSPTTLAILEGTPSYPLGDIFDILRSSLGKATSNVMSRVSEYSHGTVNLTREETGAILYQYIKGVTTNAFKSYEPNDSANIPVLVGYVSVVTTYDASTINLIFYQLYQSAQAGESGSMDVLKPTPDTLSIADNLQYGTVGTAIGTAIKNVAQGAGIDPSTLKYVVYGAGAIGIYLLILKASPKLKGSLQ